MIERNEIDRVVDSHLINPIASFDPATPIIDAVADSFAYVELALDLEEQFGLRLSDGDLAEMATVGDLSGVINDRVAALNDGALN
ncbi:MAG: acyl carrier protein [Pseudomonadota bacterium]